jgi:3'-phosphoadenosine 5'-phosphosulfate sulfotransferase (PAPS reductase)/FAD synthetase
MKNLTKEETSLLIFARALQTYKPSLVINCYSGGYDSMSATHLVGRWAKHYAHSTNVITAAVDTLISADGWRDFVKTSARAIGAPRFEIADNPGLDKWTQDVEGHGFAYRRHQHKIYFYYLKQRVFRALVQKYKTHNHDRIMFITGVRRDESKERADTPEVQRTGSAVYVNPLVYWTDEDIYLYRMKHELPINPFYETFRNSGDCLCNWHNQISLETVRQHAPNVYKTIKPLSDHCQQHHGYSYDSEPSQGAKRELAGQQRLFVDMDDVPNLCAGCAHPAPTNTVLDDVMMQRMDWGTLS